MSDLKPLPVVTEGVPYCNDACPLLKPWKVAGMENMGRRCEIEEISCTPAADPCIPAIRAERAQAERDKGALYTIEYELQRRGFAAGNLSVDETAPADVLRRALVDAIADKQDSEDELVSSMLALKEARAELHTIGDECSMASAAIDGSTASINALSAVRQILAERAQLKHDLGKRCERSLELEEEERQALLLALAMLSIERPGWASLLSDIAVRIDNVVDGRPVMFDELVKLHGAAQAFRTPSPSADLIAYIKTLPRMLTAEEVAALKLTIGGKRDT
jgi:hypothetical protein